MLFHEVVTTASALKLTISVYAVDPETMNKYCYYGTVLIVNVNVRDLTSRALG
jgi:hypothetical protein